MSSQVEVIKARLLDSTHLGKLAVCSPRPGLLVELPLTSCEREPPGEQRHRGALVVLAAYADNDA